MRKSQVLERIPANRQPEMRHYLNQIAKQWSVSHRYAPSSQIEAFLKKATNRTGRSALRDAVDEELKYTQFIIERCEAAWK